MVQPSDLSLRASRKARAAACGLALLLVPTAALPAVHTLSAGDTFSDVVDAPAALAPKLDPFGHWVVYVEDAESNGLDELWSAPLAGGEPARLSGAMSGNDEVVAFEVSPDGTFVAFLASFGTDPVQLYLAPIEGGTPLRMNQDLGGSQSVTDLEISPDSQWLLYVVSTTVTGGAERDLFRVAVSGGAAVEYTYTSGFACIHEVDSFEISPDSSAVAFRITLDCDPVYPNRLLYRAPLTSAAATQVAGTGDNGFVGQYGFTEPSAGTPVLVFVLDDDGAGPAELRRNNGAGGTTHSISGTFVANGNVTSFRPVPGGQQVVFRSDRELDQVFRLYVTNAGNDGAAQSPTRLHEEIFPTPGVRELYAIAPGGDRAVWVRDDNPVGGVPFEQLRSAAIGSPGTSLLLDETEVEDATFLRLEVSGGTARAVYLADLFEFQRFELLSTPVASSAAVRLNPTANPIATTWDVTDFAISPDGSRVHFVHDSEVFLASTHVAELRSSPITGGGSVSIGPTVDVVAGEAFAGLWAPLEPTWAVSLNDAEDTGVVRLTLSDPCLFCDGFQATGDGLARWTVGP